MIGLDIALIIAGIVLAIFVNWALGALLIVIGVILLIVGVERGRRA